MTQQPGDNIRRRLADLSAELQSQSDDIWSKPAISDIDYDDYVSDDERSKTPSANRQALSDINEHVQDIHDKADYVDLQVVVKPLDEVFHDTHQAVMDNPDRKRDWHTIAFISDKNKQSPHDILDGMLVIPRWSPYKELPVKEMEELGPIDADQRDIELHKLQQAYDAQQGYLDYRDELAASGRDDDSDMPSGRRFVGGRFHHSGNGDKRQGGNVTVRFR